VTSIRGTVRLIDDPNGDGGGLCLPNIQRSFVLGLSGGHNKHMSGSRIVRLTLKLCVRRVTRILRSSARAFLILSLVTAGLVAPAGARALSASGFTYSVSGSATTVTGCSTLPCSSSLAIPATLGGHTVTAIGNYAFYDRGIVAVTMPNTITNIGDGAFSTGLFESNALTQVSLPSSLQTIGIGAFSGNKLGSLDLPNSVITIGNYAFTSNVLITVSIPGSVTSIGIGAFSGNLIASLDLPDARMSIGAYAFAGNAIQSLVIPGSIATIEDNAFANNALSFVEFLGNSLPPSRDVFAGNDGLRWAARPPNATGWSYEWGDLPLAFSAKLTYTTTNGSATVTGCDGVCSAVVDIPTLLGGNPVTKIAASALFMENVIEVSIPESVIEIGNFAFENNRIDTLSLSNSLKKIGNYAFQSNYLATLYIPESVTKIGKNAFANNALTSVRFLGNAPTAGGKVFLFNAELASVTRSNGATGWSGTWGGARVVIGRARATSTVKPRITGTAKVGATLTAVKGTWTGYPKPTYTYQWYACTSVVSVVTETVPETCAVIKKATKSTFKLTAAQKQKYVTVRVTGTSTRTAATSWLSLTTVRIGEDD